MTQPCSPALCVGHLVTFILYGIMMMIHIAAGRWKENPHTGVYKELNFAKGQ